MISTHSIEVRKLIRLAAPALVPIIACIVLLLNSPEAWRFSPDSGIYIGSAVELVEHGRYWFDGHPNLHFFPGTSVSLTPVIAAFGLDFQALQFLIILLSCAAIICCYKYYQDRQHAWLAPIVVYLVFCNKLFLSGAMIVASSALFLLLVMASFVAWKRFIYERRHSDAYLCLTLVAFAPMVRMEGVLLAIAFGAAILVDQWRKHAPRQAIQRAAIASMVLATPFLLWVLRNYIEFEPGIFYRFDFGQDVLKQEPVLKVRELLPHLDSSTSTIGYIWYNISSTVDALLDSILHHRIGMFVSPAVSVSVVLPLLILGFSAWLRFAHLFEALFVLLLALFLFHYQHQHLTSNSLIARYWLPLLPSLLAMLALGGFRVFKHVQTLLFKKLIQCLGLLVMLTTLITAIAHLRYFERSEKQFTEGYINMQGASNWINKYTEKSSIVAVTDWGAMPMLLDRTSVLALNDFDHAHTLPLLLEGNVGYLVIVDGMAVYTANASRQLVARYPQVFQTLISFPSQYGKFSTDVYSVDSSALKALGESGFPTK